MAPAPAPTAEAVPGDGAPLGPTTEVVMAIAGATEAGGVMALSRAAASSTTLVGRNPPSPI
eukprot:5679188-Lingulodinium_polyedra.AAC.1